MEQGHPLNAGPVPTGSPPVPWRLRDRGGMLLFAAVGVVYVGLRLLGLAQARLVENHDSISYILQIDALMREGLGALGSFGPDSTPFFPLVGALFGTVAGSAEAGARAASLVLSLLMLVALFGIGRRLGPPMAVAAGLLLVAFNPLLIGLSYSILTEPSFVATFYVAAWIFWAQFKKPGLAPAALLGFVAGLAFLSRLEGLLLLGFFPVLQAIHYLFGDDVRYDRRRLAAWTGVFAVCFAAVAVPQVWKTSDQMGRLALNGRQAWVALLNEGDQAYEPTIYGLDHDPGVINLEYVQANPEALGQAQSDVSPRAMLRRIVLNADTLLGARFSELVGAAVLALFGLGLVDLWTRKMRFEAFAVLAMIGVGVAAPLAHTMADRHVAVVVPIMLLTAGFGAAYAARALVTGGPGVSLRRLRLTTAALTAVALAGWAYPLSVIVRGLDRPNMEYHPDDFTEPIQIVRSIVERDLRRSPVVVARRSYFPYYLGAGHERLHLPYTDYGGLLRYARINRADFLYLLYSPAVMNRPFIAAFSGDHPPPEFELLYRGLSSLGERVELYRFRDSEGNSGGTSGSDTG